MYDVNPLGPLMHLNELAASGPKTCSAHPLRRVFSLEIEKMDFLDDLKARIPDFAKDVRLNLDSVLTRSSLERADALGAALAAAYAARSKALVDAIRGAGQLNDVDTNAALSAAALMGMNNVYYPYVEMAEDPDLQSQRPKPLDGLAVQLLEMHHRAERVNVVHCLVSLRI